MRKKLADSAGVRKRFQATFSRYGKRVNFKGYSEETILLTDVVDFETKQLVTSHLWFAYSKAFQKIRLNQGCIIAFDARVKEYTKGYVNRRAGIDNAKTDFKLSNPTRISLVPQVA